MDRLWLGYDLRCSLWLTMWAEICGMTRIVSWVGIQASNQYVTFDQKISAIISGYQLDQRGLLGQRDIAFNTNLWRGWIEIIGARWNWLDGWTYELKTRESWKTLWWNKIGRSSSWGVTMYSWLASIGFNVLASAKQCHMSLAGWGCQQFYSYLFAYVKCGSVTLRAQRDLVWKKKNEECLCSDNCFLCIFCE